MLHLEQAEAAPRGGARRKAGEEAQMADKTDARRGRGRPRLRDRQAVLDQAMAHYWRDGVEALSLNELCRRIGTAKPSLYRDFGGEDGLQDAVLDHYRGAVIAPLLDFLASDPPFSPALEAMIVGMTSPGDKPPGCLFTEMRMLRTRLGPKSLARLDAMEAERQHAFAEWYARVLARGEANPALSPAEAARYLDAQFTLLLLHMGTGQSPEAVRERARLALSVLRLSD